MSKSKLESSSSSLGSKPKKITPLMAQYESIKKDHPDDLLLFRMGDFYELFNEDAVEASKFLNITLTKRNKKSGDDTWMCGFPHHSMEGPVNKLLEGGYCVAICDQLEDPQEAKGLVKRGVTLMLSPGVVFNPDQLASDQAHYIFSFTDSMAAWFDPSTGKAFFKKIKQTSEVQSLIFNVNPKEVLVFSQKAKEQISFYRGSVQELYQKEKFADLSLEKDPRENLLSYVKKMQGEHALFGFQNWVEVEEKNQLKLNYNFFKHMEVFESNEGDKTKSLFHVIKKTKTPGGARLLRNWLETPLIHKSTILKRHKHIKKWTKSFFELERFRGLLSDLGDIERRITRAGHSLGAPQDLVRLKKSLGVFIRAFSETEDLDLKKVEELYEFLEKRLVEEPVSHWQTKGGYLKKGFSEDLDELIGASTGAQNLISDLEEKERAKTGIVSLKIRFNSVFGFYIEVTKAHKDKVPDYYVRRQTLTNAERYTTPELSAIEEKVLTAKSKKLILEKELFTEIKEQIRLRLHLLNEVAHLASLEDVSASLAFLMVEKNFNLPVFSLEEGFKLKEGFHPVVAEDLLQRGKDLFVTNDVEISKSTPFYLITGPNMAGKSTFMRMVALNAYLAQCGLPVPAKSCEMQLYESIYTRIGASDMLSEGLSTFMVEMKETAEILKGAGENSLLILDEIGRGTSSHDGRALAESISTYILKHLKSHTFFATHYHELTEVFADENLLTSVHMGYQEKENKIYFTYKLKSGAAKKSYGIEVAELSGLPKEVIQLAKEKSVKKVGKSLELQSPQMTFEFESLKESELETELQKLKLSEMTPLEALNRLSEWQENYL